MTNGIDSICNFLANKYPIFTGAQPYLPRLPEFYCTYKTHRNSDPPPLRPITSQIHSPAQRLSELTHNYGKG